MKKILISLSLLLAVVGAMAVPAKKGVWKTLPLNGTVVRAQLMGDEHMHYWLTDDGRQLTEQADGTFALADMQQLRTHAAERRARVSEHRARRAARHNAIGDFTHYTGQKKGLIILVEFTNMQFQAANDSLRYTRICNEEGYSEGSFRGSVYDYFKAQSYGQFELTFDIVGPVQMTHGYEYYGQDSGGQGDDIRPGEMVATACQAIVDLVDFSDYDWDGDGYVDQVMCIYAGQGQADGGAANTIWPHEWELESSDWGSVLELDGVKINTYACANERRGSSIEGIGTICHEFSHCLGLPDMYDIQYGGNYGMGEWSLMDSGSYNGDGFCPAGYSSFDKYTCGWVEPVEMRRNMLVTGMKPLEDEPEVYMVRNEAYPDEYFLLENRQKKGWDAELPGSGMLILYVDYDHEIWEYNLVNTNYGGSSYYGYPSNDHQRCTPFHADNSPSSYSDVGVPYPYQGNDSLTNTSAPAAKLYHENTDGSLLMNKGIMDIARGDGGTMSFRFRNSAKAVYIPEGTLLYESFDMCGGTGGNDNLWDATIASSIFIADNEGWDVKNAYGGYQCARFGTLLGAGRATTPEFTMETATANVTFRASGWGTDGTTLQLSVDGDGTVEPSSVELESFAWTDYTVKLTGKGPLRLTFTPKRRFLLDELLVVGIKTDIEDGISQLPVQDVQRAGYYTLDGRFVGTSFASLPRGLYIQVADGASQGRKVMR